MTHRGQEGFEAAHRAEWEAFEADLAVLDRPRAVQEPGRIAAFPSHYRRICQHLALARHRRYSAQVVGHLNELALQGHVHLYRRPQTIGLVRLLTFLAITFPQAARRLWRSWLVASVLLYVPAAAIYVAIQLRSDLVYSIIDPATVRELEAMYRPHAGHLVERASDSDLMMFGFYIWNNISIAFRTFAGGALLGLGSLYFLISNGLILGAVFGHLHRAGLDETLLPFAVGHGAFELTAICLAGAAGLHLGMAILAPGNRTRRASLFHAAREAAPVVQGVAVMLLVAAFLEAFWGPRASVPAVVKFAVGGLLWSFVHLWLLLGGSRRAA